MTKKINDLTNFEKARWFSLLKGIDIVDENCESLGKDFETIELKPIALKHYVNALAEKMQVDLDQIDNLTRTSEMLDDVVFTITQSCDASLNNIN